LSHKKFQIDKKKIDALKVELSFYTMINMKIKFHFNIINLKDQHFHVDLSRFYKIASTCRKCSILQNGLQIDEILNISYFQVMKTLKNTFVL
jgi:hypothetical protein